ncbi:MAG: hypothetical protein QOG55_372 [Acidobacteriaceae bacterium]|nr:hypothetical protein [Acidobacteriaceae bacterium]
MQVHLDVRHGDGCVGCIALATLSGDSSVGQKIRIAGCVFSFRQRRHIRRRLGGVESAAREVDALFVDCHSGGFVLWAIARESRPAQAADEQRFK